MAIKTVRQRTEEGGDILGLVAFGSLITNIFQIASGKALAEEHAALKAYAGELKKHYENMRARERLVYKENIELKNAYQGLQVLNSRLLSELVEARKETFALKLAKTSFPVKRAIVRKTTGGSR